jgi:hypothetical protein
LNKEYTQRKALERERETINDKLATAADSKREGEREKLSFDFNCGCFGSLSPPPQSKGKLIQLRDIFIISSSSFEAAAHCCCC